MELDIIPYKNRIGYNYIKNGIGQITYKNGIGHNYI